jgi:hypothetical protein
MGFFLFKMPVEQAIRQRKAIIRRFHKHFAPVRPSSVPPIGSGAYPPGITNQINIIWIDLFDSGTTLYRIAAFSSC